jgi:hypothetical protein
MEVSCKNRTFKPVFFKRIEQVCLNENSIHKPGSEIPGVGGHRKKFTSIFTYLCKFERVVRKKINNR